MTGSPAWPTSPYRQPSNSHTEVAPISVSAFWISGSFQPLAIRGHSYATSTSMLASWRSRTARASCCAMRRLSSLCDSIFARTVSLTATFTCCQDDHGRQGKDAQMMILKPRRAAQSPWRPPGPRVQDLEDPTADAQGASQRALLARTSRPS